MKLSFMMRLSLFLVALILGFPRGDSGAQAPPSKKIKIAQLLQPQVRKKYSSVAPTWVGRSVGGTPMARVQHWVLDTRDGAAVITEKFDIRGVSREQTLNIKDRTQSEIDFDGDGQLDEWSLTANDLRILLHSPREGHFRFMEIRKETKTEWIDLLFLRNKKGHYALINRTSEKKFALYSSVDVAKDDFVAGQCRETEEQLQSEVSDFNAKLRSGEVSDSTVRGLIEHQILDASCHKPGMEAQREKIVEAMKKVFESDKDFSVAEQQSKMEKNKKVFAREFNDEFEPDARQPKFLGCLRRYQMDTHATRIASALQTKMHTNAWSWKVQCKTALPEHAGKCGSIAMVHDPKKKETHQHVSFLIHPANSQDAANCDASLEKTFMHEMLHYSGIQDESLVDNITACCLQDRPQNSACGLVRFAIKRKLAAQKMWNLVVDSLSPQDFDTLKMHCEKLYGADCDKNVKRVIDNASLSGSTIIHDPKRCPGGPERITADCAKALKEEGVKQVRSIFSDKVCHTNRLREVDPKHYSANRERVDRELELECAAFNAEVARIFSGDPDKSDVERICSQRRSLTYNQFQLLFDHLLSSAFGSQYGAGLCDDLAKVKSSMKWENMRTISDRQGSAGDVQWRNTAREMLSEASNQVTSDAGHIGRRVDKLIGGQRPVEQDRVLKMEDGPSRKTAFADLSSSERIKRVNHEIRKQNDLSERLQKFSSIPFEALLPTASARAADRESLSAVRRLSLPDPLSSEMDPTIDREDIRSMDMLGSRGIETRSARNSKAERSVASEILSRSAGSETPPALNRNRVLAGKASSPQPTGSVGAAKAPVGRGKVTGGSASAGSSIVSTDKGRSKDDPRARAAFVEYLLSLKAHQVAPELELESTQSQLHTHRVAVIDEAGKHHGPNQEVAKWLVFNHEKRRLRLLAEKE